MAYRFCLADAHSSAYSLAAPFIAANLPRFAQ